MYISKLDFGMFPWLALEIEHVFPVEWVKIKKKFQAINAYLIYKT